MRRLFIAIAIVGVVAFIAHQFLFADRRSRLRLGSGSSYSTEENTSIPNTKRLLVRNASIVFKVPDAIKARDAIHDLTKGFDGYVHSENQMGKAGLRYLEIVRVPSELTDEFIRRIEKLAIEVEAKRSSSIDVTEEFIDVKSRLQTKRKLETRYEEIIKRAGNVKDLLEIEVQLGTLRSEIESMESKFNSLENQISFGSVSLEFYEEGASNINFASDLATSLNDGWNGLLVVMVFILKAWPLLIVGIIAAVIYIRRRAVTFH